MTAVTEVVYLQNGERRPNGDRSVLIECLPGKRGKRVQASPQGPTTLTVGPEALDATVADMEKSGEPKVYVRLAPRPPELRSRRRGHQR